MANPADAFGLFNLASSEATAAAAGIGGAAATIPRRQSAASILLWPHAMKKPLLLVLLLAACREETAQDFAPVALTADAIDHYCQMNVTEHEGPKAQIHLQGLPQAPLFFAQVRDAVAYARMPACPHARTDPPHPHHLGQRHGRDGRNMGRPR